MSTQEIAKAVQNLEVKTLQEALKAVGAKTDATEKDKLIEAYQNSVLETGLKNFVAKLNDKDVEISCQALGVEVPSNKKEAKKTLEESLLNGGITTLLAKAEEKLLHTYCDTLGLQQSSAMSKEIADEVMLTGMERFLNQLNNTNLKAHCVELKLTSTGSKKDLVERLMVHIFELEPLDEDDKEKPKDGKKDKKDKSPKKEKAEKKSPKKEKEEKKPKEPKRRNQRNQKNPKNQKNQKKRNQRKNSLPLH